jgi:hypothetical protein
MSKNQIFDPKIRHRQFLLAKIRKFLEHFRLIPSPGLLLFEWNLYKNDSYWGFFYARNRLRALPNRKNAFLILIQGKGWVYQSKNEPTFGFSSKNGPRGFSRRGIV